MTFNWQQILRETAEYLVDMRSWPGFTEYARGRLAAMTSDPVWSGLHEEVQRVLKERKSAASALAVPPSEPTTPGT